MSKWHAGSAEQTVTSVNGHTGDVVLGAADVGVAQASVLRYATNRWYTSIGGTRATQTRPSGFVTFTPLIVDVAHTFTAIGVEVAAVAAGSVIRLGVYADNVGQPGDLILDAGTVDSTTTGIKSITGLTLTLNPGVYWLAANPQGGAPNCRVHNGGSVAGAPIVEGTNFAMSVGWSIGAGPTSGGLPANGSAAVPTDIVILAALKA